MWIRLEPLGRSQQTTTSFLGPASQLCSFPIEILQ